MLMIVAAAWVVLYSSSSYATSVRLTCWDSVISQQHSAEQLRTDDVHEQM
ncbi:MAG: hypothetical protein H9847_02215 [Candidatus Anaerobiospirillum pullicola]|uniref:Uncharacterized protein n=1 Tax=Candidatus Anaerobiospirillum pullicola TaxID=2838451 RepID=A0A948TEN9_9GAMM|nr:hypothetical protein [Candidatus Anaerobiospirillum pullicola]